MEFSTEAKEVFKTVMKVQNANGVKMAFENQNGLSKFNLDVKTLDSNDRIVLVDDVPVALSEEDEKTLKNIRFIVQEGKITMESIGDCACCEGCKGCDK